MNAVAGFERQVEQTPSAAALSFSGAVLTYEALNARANQIAHHLRAQGVGAAALVALCMPRSIDLVPAILGIHKAGGAYVPLDPDFPVERLAYMLQDSGAGVLLTACDAHDGIDVPHGVRIVELDRDAPRLDAQPTHNPLHSIRPDDPAYVIYTSGSTGRPKGVIVPHAAFANFLGSMQQEPGLSRRDVLAAVTTISFDIAGLELYLPLQVGARIELVPHDTTTDGTALANLLADSEATVLQATPATWRLLLGVDWRPKRRFRALCGGEPLPREVADALLDRVDELWNLYGPTETTVWSTLDRVDGGPITIGRPIANTQVYVVDTAGDPVPVGVVGEIWIGGDGVALGYLQRPELTAEKFVPDRVRNRPGARVYRTGDLGRWREDGRLECLGRMDHQVKIRGFRIELGEIETALASHEAVCQAVVVARPANEDDLRLVAYIVCHPGSDLTASDVRRYLRRTLPDYMVPSVVVPMDSVPLTPNGKVDRAALPDPFRHTQRAAGDGFDAPATATEQTIAEIWCEALKVERVAASDNFFELGGHSLLSLSVAAEIRKRTGWQMDPRALFFQTLRQVAALADSGAPSGPAGL
jgi:amino acid adenylation domain-containing protein